MDAPSDPGIVKQLLDWVWLGFVALLGIVYRMMSGKLDGKAESADVKEMKESIHALRNKMVTREDFARHEASDQKDRDERRDDIKELFGKVDDLKTDLGNRFDALKDILLQRRP
jgi:hypothetical protein